MAQIRSTSRSILAAIIIAAKGERGVLVEHEIGVQKAGVTLRCHFSGQRLICYLSFNYVCLREKYFCKIV